MACYRLETGKWEPPSYGTPPDEFHLRAETGTSKFERGVRTVRPVIPSQGDPSGFWQWISRDSVRVVWTDGFVGVVLRVRVSEDSLLEGTAKVFTDVVGGPPLPQTEVVGRRIECAQMEE